MQMSKHALLGALAAVCLVGGARAQSISPGNAAAWVSVLPIPAAPNSSSLGYVPGYVVEEFDPSAGYPRVTSPTHPLDVNVVSGGGSSSGNTTAATNPGTSAATANPVQGVTGGVPVPTLDSTDRTNDAGTTRQQTHDDTLAGSQAGAGLKTTDANNTSLGGTGAAPLTATVGTAYPVGRSLQTNCTTGGTITFTENGTGVPWIVGVGTTEIAHVTTMVSSAGAAVCAYIVHY